MPDELKGVLNNIERDTDIIYPSIKNDWLLPDTGANSSIVEAYNELPQNVYSC